MILSHEGKRKKVDMLLNVLNGRGKMMAYLKPQIVAY
jgi:hypothetical protein